MFALPFVNRCSASSIGGDEGAVFVLFAPIFHALIWMFTIISFCHAGNIGADLTGVCFSIRVTNVGFIVVVMFFRGATHNHRGKQNGA